MPASAPTAPSVSSSTAVSARDRRNVLVVGVSPEEFGRVAPFLERNAFDVDRFPRAAGALELLSRVAFEVLIARDPLPDMDLHYFLEAVRQADSPCLHAPLLVLATDESQNAEQFVGRGANRVVRMEESARQIQSTVSALLNVAPRKAARFVTRLEVKLGGAKDMIVCQTENISASGILLKTDRRYEKGTRINIELSLEDDPRPIVAIAEVVRHTLIGREQIGGIGMRFLSFAGDSQRRFQGFLERM